MRVVWVLIACLSYLTLVYADDRITSATQTSRSETISREPAITSDPAPETTSESAAVSRERQPSTQTIKSDSPRTTFDTINTPSSVNPMFTSINSRCAIPGELIIVSGQNLTSLSPGNLSIKLGNNYLNLQTVTTSNTQMVVKLPTSEALQQNHHYSLFWFEPPLKYSELSLKLLICSEKTITSNIKNDQDRELGQLLILSKQKQLAQIKHYLTKQSIAIQQEQELSSLKQILLTIAVEEKNISETFNDLQQRFPEATIDFNTHYQATANPRLYASEKIAWSPHKQPCQLTTHLKIGIIDGLINTMHPALSDQVITVNNFVDESDLTEQQHGTAIAVILAGDKKELGYQGLLTGSTLLNASVLHQRQDQLIANTDAIVAAIDWLIGEKVRLVNISLSSPNQNRILKNILSTAINSGLIVFSAAGNNGKNAQESYPAAYEGVFAITAIDAVNRIYSDANQGSYIDFSAPGVDLWLVENTDHGHYGSGTSFASPYALAVAALFLNQNPSLSATVLYNAMKSNIIDLGETGKDNVFGWGLVQTPKGLCANPRESN